MPKIIPYKIQTEANSVPDVKYVRPTTAEGEGKGIAALGAGIGDLGDALAKREEQQDITDTHVKLSQAQSDLTNSYQQQLRDGSLNTDDFKDQVQDKMDGIADELKTTGGTNYFKKASAELQSHYLVTAAQGDAQLQGEKAKDNYMQSLNNSANSLMQDPSSFDFSNSQQQTALDAQVASGTIPAKIADDLKVHSTNELAKASIRGWARMDPDQAKQQLDSGQWDKYLGDKSGNGAEVKSQMYGVVHQEMAARDIEDRRQQKVQDDALKAQQVQVQNDFLQQIEDGKLKTQNILDSNLDPTGSGSKVEFMRMLDKSLTDTKEKPMQNDPYKMKEIFDRIHLPDGDPRKITDENDLNKFFGDGLNMQGLQQMRGELGGKGTLEGAAASQQKKTFFQAAYNSIAKPDPITKLPDPEGAKLYQTFQMQALQDYQEGIKAGKKPSDLLNPNGNDYIGKNMQLYQRSPQEIVSSIVNQRGTQSTEKMIDVIDPNGRPGKIPASKLEQAKAQKYKIVGQ